MSWCRTLLLFALALSCPFVAPFARADAPVAFVATGAVTSGLAIDPVTNTIFAAHSANNTVSIINGQTYQRIVTTYPAGTSPGPIAINPATGIAYMIARGSPGLARMQGFPFPGGGGVSALPTTPYAIALNPVTNTIFVTHLSTASVSVVNGDSMQFTTVPVQVNPVAVAVNPLTNKAYVANRSSNTVTEIDGTTLATTTFTVGANPSSLAVNPATNRVYVANQTGNSVSVIDVGAGTITTLAVGTAPFAVAVNPVTNKAYVSNRNSSSVSVIDGNNLVGTIATAVGPAAITVDPATNTVMVACNPSQFTIIDSATDAIVGTITAGSNSSMVAANPVTGKAFLTENSGVRVVDASRYALSTWSLPAPANVVVNRYTGKTYVSNNGSAGSVSVLDTSGQLIDTVAAGSFPGAMAIDPVTQRVFAVNVGGDTVTAIDGASNAVTQITVGQSPRNLAINPRTRRVYVSNISSASVSVIDGFTLAVLATIPVGPFPGAVAVNAATNKIYVRGDDSVKVIDGVTHAVTSIPMGTGSGSLALHAGVNLIYASNTNTNTVSIIDGATDTITASVPTGANAQAIAIHPNGRVYVANGNSASVTIIEGTTTQTVNVGNFPRDIAIDAVNDKIYVANANSNFLSVIDANSRVVQNLPLSFPPSSVHVNPVTNRVYVPSSSTGSVIVFDVRPLAAPPHASSVSMAGGHLTSLAAPALSVNVDGAYAPAEAPVRSVYFRDTNAQGPYAQASGSGPFTVFLPSLGYGDNVAIVFAADGLEGTSFNSAFGNAGGSSAFTGPPKVFAFARVDPPQFLTAITLPAASTGTPVNTQLNVRSDVGGLSFAVVGGTFPPGLTLSSSGLISGIPTTGLTYNFTVEVTDASGGTASRSFTQAIAVTTRTLTVTKTGNGTVTAGGINCGADCSEAYAYNDTITLTATPAIGSFFTGWSGACTVTTMTCTVTMTAALTVTANFAPLALTRVFSTKTHGAAGAFELDVDPLIPLNGNVIVEPRQAGSGHVVVFRFNGNINAAAGLSAVDGNLANVPISSVRFSSRDVIVTLGVVPDGTRVRVAMTSVNSAAMSISASLAYMLGDIGQTRATTAADIAALKARRTFDLASGNNYLFDVNLSGAIDDADVAIVKSRSGRVVP